MYKGKTIVIVGLVNLFWLILSWLGLRKTEGKFWKVFRNCLLIDIIVRVVGGILTGVACIVDPEEGKRFLNTGEC